ncbi:MAG TPA: hypothetical protein VFT96_04500 [Gemmatimonadaceae bacterium]|nr:hypothetical protein [Gemmatimonadaceae bacterium]
MSEHPHDERRDAARLLAAVERLYDAVVSRDAAVVHALIDSAMATRIPREVREEALAITALPAGSARVPMALLRYHHRLTQLAGPDDRDAAFLAERDADAREGRRDGVDLVADAAPEPDPAQMEIPFVRDRNPWRSVNAQRGSRGGPPRDRV